MTTIPFTVQIERQREAEKLQEMLNDYYRCPSKRKEQDFDAARESFQIKHDMDFVEALPAKARAVS